MGSFLGAMMGELFMRFLPPLKAFDRLRLREYAWSEVHSLQSIYRENFTFHELGGQVEGVLVIDNFRNLNIVVKGPPISRVPLYDEICPNFDMNEPCIRYHFKQLPPLEFRFQLSIKYPKSEGLTFELVGDWMEGELKDVLMDCLDSLKTDEGSSQPLTACCSFLHSHIVRYLLESRGSGLYYFNMFRLIESREVRERVIERLVTHQEGVHEMEFLSKSHECPVCWETYKGKNCLRLLNCKHVVCSSCAGNSFQYNIREGTNSGSPICPQCGVAVRPQEVSFIFISRQIFRVILKI